MTIYLNKFMKLNCNLKEFYTKEQFDTINLNNQVANMKIELSYMQAKPDVMYGSVYSMVHNNQLS